jgi:hypothetical protein
MYFFPHYFSPFLLGCSLNFYYLFFSAHIVRAWITKLNLSTALEKFTPDSQMYPLSHRPPNPPTNGHRMAVTQDTGHINAWPYAAEHLCHSLISAARHILNIQKVWKSIQADRNQVQTYWWAHTCWRDPRLTLSGNKNGDTSLSREVPSDIFPSRLPDFRYPAEHPSLTGWCVTNDVHSAVLGPTFPSDTQPRWSQGAGDDPGKGLLTSSSFIFQVP